MILIGSRAIAYHFKDYKIRESADTDFIISREQEKFFNIVNWPKEKEIYSYKDPSLPKVELYRLEDGSNSLIKYDKNDVANPIDLLTIKMSHIHHLISKQNWNKHIYDIWFLQNKLKDEYKSFDFIFGTELYKQRKAEADKRYKNPRRPNWKLTNEEFFKESQKVNRKHTHDDLHHKIKYYNDPLYNTIKIDINYAHCSEQLFNELNYLDKCRVIWEEAYALTLERYIIDKQYKNYKVEYRKTIRDMVTRLTGGWFRNFIIANYYVLYNPELDFVKKYNSSISI